MNRKTGTKKSGGATTVAGYDGLQAAAQAAVCRKLRKEICAALPKATSKIWHGSPVWFVGETPVVGYNVTAKGDISLLFWNGQAFGDAALEPIGKFAAAQARYMDAKELELAPLRRWLKLAGTQLWDLGVLRELRARTKTKTRKAR
ncbi:MAG: DUF1801 domain-containing protein [Planctomycetes bacterium]|nr:DUF1801 domain-containing protein [Planctomycetota bacterium]